MRMTVDATVENFIRAESDRMFGSYKRRSAA